MNIIMSLYEWQTDCLKSWARNGYRCIVNVITVSGKTVLALAAVKRPATASDRELRAETCWLFIYSFVSLVWNVYSYYGNTTSELEIDLDSQSRVIMRAIYGITRANLCYYP